MCSLTCLNPIAIALNLLLLLLVIAPLSGVHHPPIHDIVTTQDIIAGDVFFEITEPAVLEYTYRLRPAKDFGISFVSQRYTGIALVLTQPADACSKIRNYREVRGNVALIKRGDCSFLTKTINAENAGAKAAIMTEFDDDSAEFEYYIEMVHDNTSREAHIPAGFLLGKNGIVIRSTLMSLRWPHVIINIPVNLTFVPPAQINHPPWLGW